MSMAALYTLIEHAWQEHSRCRYTLIRVYLAHSCVCVAGLACRAGADTTVRAPINGSSIKRAQPVSPAHLCLTHRDRCFSVLTLKGGTGSTRRVISRRRVPRCPCRARRSRFAGPTAQTARHAQRSPPSALPWWRRSTAGTARRPARQVRQERARKTRGETETAFMKQH